MPPFAIGPIGSVSSVRPVAGGAPSAPERRTGDELRVAPGDRPASAVANRELLDPGPQPLDAERVAQIRKAVENGTYPLNPAAVADAFIAAGYILRTSR